MGQTPNNDKITIETTRGGILTLELNGTVPLADMLRLLARLIDRRGTHGAIATLLTAAKQT